MRVLSVVGPPTAAAVPATIQGEESAGVIRPRPARYLAGQSDERALLGERLALAERCLLEQRVVDDIAPGLEEGLGFRATIDPPIAGLPAALDGRCTLGDVAGELARLEGATRAGIEQAGLPAHVIRAGT
jgi:hypothetical protein